MYFEAALQAHSIKHSFRPDSEEATADDREDEARWARAYSKPWFQAVVVDGEPRQSDVPRQEALF